VLTCGNAGTEGPLCARLSGEFQQTAPRMRWQRLPEGLDGTEARRVLRRLAHDRTLDDADRARRIRDRFSEHDGRFDDHDD
jgi:hypothetical protein